ncbi:MAG: ribosome recycling factor [Candidatus Saccharimonadales bacterium]
MESALEHFSEELKSVRSGRANAALVENLEVECYGQNMALKAIASITTPDGKTIVIAPWDVNNTPAIEKAIRDDKNLDLNPISDGKVIHIQLPPPTAERRQQLSKQVSEVAEEANIAIRNIRHDGLKSLQNQLKDKEISEDDFESGKKDLDKLITDFSGKIDGITENKRKEIEEI